MLTYIWPIALVVAANVFYNICTKSVPEGMDPFASLTVTYTVSAVASAVLFFLLSPGHDLAGELSKINFASIGLGVVIVGLEVGFIYAYRAGWQVNTAFIVQSAFVSVLLAAVGALLYREVITWNKAVGIVICLVGLVFINLK